MGATLRAGFVKGPPRPAAPWRIYKYVAIEAALAAARAELGTASMKDTVTRLSGGRRHRVATGPRSLSTAWPGARATNAGSLALTHLVDISVISRLGRAEVRAVVEPLAQAGRLGRAGVGDLEVGYGRRNAADWDQDMADLSVFELVEPGCSSKRPGQLQHEVAALSAPQSTGSLRPSP